MHHALVLYGNNLVKEQSFIFFRTLKTKKYFCYQRIIAYRQFGFHGRDISQMEGVVYLDHLLVDEIVEFWVWKDIFWGTLDSRVLQEFYFLSCFIIIMSLLLIFNPSITFFCLKGTFISILCHRCFITLLSETHVFFGKCGNVFNLSSKSLEIFYFSYDKATQSSIDKT